MPPKVDKANFNDFLDNKIFKDISNDLEKLSNDIRQPDKFAQIFCEAAQKQKSIDCAIRDVIVDLLGKNADVRQLIIEVVEKVDRGYERLLLGKAGVAIWTIIIMIIEGVILSYFK